MRRSILHALTLGISAGLLAGLPLTLPAAEPPAKTEPVQAAEKPKAEAKTESVKPAVAKKKRDTFPFHGKIRAVNSVDKTITLEGKTNNRIIQVTSQTRMVKAGQPATFKDALVGEEIAGMVKRIDATKYEAVSLRLGPKPKRASKPKAPIQKPTQPE